MRLRSKIAAVALAIAAAAAPVIVSAGPAQAAGQICENGGAGLCLNDWNGAGSGGAVKMGQNGWPHQNFGTFQLTTMCGAGRVTHTCPFTNTSLDNAMFDHIIVAVKYLGNGLCVGTSQTTRGAVLTTCPNSGGGGGGWGTVMVQRTNVNNCFTQNGDEQLMDRLWSDNDATATVLTGSTAQGNQAAMFTQTNPAIVCWGTG